MVKKFFLTMAIICGTLQIDNKNVQPDTIANNIDTKSLVDRPGVTPEVFYSLIDFLKSNKTDLLGTITNLENLIIRSTDGYEHEIPMNYTPVDYKKEQKLFETDVNINKTKKRELEDLYSSLNRAWLFLSKKLPSKYKDKTTLIEFGLPFFVPGGRFNEFYYWDSFWILRGLLTMNMEESATNLIKNFIAIINRYNYIPNGSRMYYLGRTQPPYFTQMIYYLYSYNKEKYKEFVVGEALDAAIKEYEWLSTNRSVTFKKDNKSYTMSRYIEESSLPRLESFKEDQELAFSIKPITVQETKQIFTELRSGAESGWDFSTRWLKDDMSLSTIHTSDFIPADLNAIMFKNEKIISELLKLRNNYKFSKIFKEKSIKRLESIQEVLWNKEQLIWNDYNFNNNEMNDKRFYFSNITPLCLGINPPAGNANDILYKYRSVLFKYIGGIPCSGESAVVSDQQWDFPNLWAPHQSIMVDYLLKNDYYTVAVHVARSFYENIKKGFEKHKVFFEKYNCKKLGETGKGGEYKPQEGFGWTNGVAIEFINTFKYEFVKDYNHKTSYEEVVSILASKSITLNNKIVRTSNVKKDTSIKEVLIDHNDLNDIPTPLVQGAVKQIN